jgi:eukaryotic-like serine/threonine-protein kinase
VPDLPAGIIEGEIFAGKYRIGKVIGAGAMGTVVAAHHLLLDQKVAIKFLIPEASVHSESLSRFLREARAAVRIKSHHVARVLDVAVIEGGGPYIVMEYLEGCDLAIWLRDRGVLPVEQAVDFVLQACDAIAEAHDLQIIHRDLKPANLFAVESSGVVQTIKVLDFGISKTQGLVSRTLAPADCKPGSVLTDEKTIIGSLFYMSPEQMESARDVDARTDIWALGVTLWELMTGKLPFEGTSILQVYSRIAADTPLTLRDTSPHVPRELEAVIVKCLARVRDKRFSSVYEFARALVRFGSTRAVTYVERIARAAQGLDYASPDSPSAMTPSPRAFSASDPGRTLLSPDSEQRPVRRRRHALGAWLTAAVVVVGTAVLLKVVPNRLPGDGHVPSATSVRVSVAAPTPLVAPARSVASSEAAQVVGGTPSASHGGSNAASLEASAASSGRPHAVLAPSVWRAPPMNLPAREGGPPQAATRDARPPPSDSAAAPSATEWSPPDNPK